MSSKNVVDQDIYCCLRRCVFVIDFAKDIMTFFDQLVNDRAYGVFLVDLRQFSDEIHSYVLPSLDDYREENQ